MFTILDPGTNPDCVALESVRQDIEQAGLCQLGGCGEGRGRWEGNGPPRLDRNSPEFQEIENQIEAVLNRPDGR